MNDEDVLCSSTAQILKEKGLDDKEIVKELNNEEGLPDYQRRKTSTKERERTCPNILYGGKVRRVG